MTEIRVFTSPDSVCYTFVFVATISVFLGYVATEPPMEIMLKVISLLAFFGLVIVLILACKLIDRIAKMMDNFFEKRK